MSEMLSSLEHLVRKHPSGTVSFREGDRGLAFKQRFEYAEVDAA